MLTQHLIPAIIPDTFDRLEEQLRLLRGVLRYVQVDVMDGSYTKDVSWPYASVDRAGFEASWRKDEGLPYWQDFSFEIDLLLQNPEERIESWILAGASTLIVHLESTTQLETILATCHERRVEVAIALKPATDIDLLAPFAEHISFVQCMGSSLVGRQGVRLEEGVPDKIRALKSRWPALTIGVDIGVHEGTLPLLAAAGATRFAAGSAVFATGDPAGEAKRLEALAVACLTGQR